MVIFCIYTRERAKKPPNSEAKNLRTTFAPSKKKFRDCSLAYTYTYTLKEITA